MTRGEDTVGVDAVAGLHLIEQLVHEGDVSGAICGVGMGTQDPPTEVAPSIKVPPEGVGVDEDEVIGRRFTLEAEVPDHRLTE